MARRPGMWPSRPHPRGLPVVQWVDDVIMEMVWLLERPEGPSVLLRSNNNSRTLIYGAPRQEAWLDKEKIRDKALKPSGSQWRNHPSEQAVPKRASTNSFQPEASLRAGIGWRGIFMTLHASRRPVHVNIQDCSEAIKTEVLFPKRYEHVQDFVSGKSSHETIVHIWERDLMWVWIFDVGRDFGKIAPIATLDKRRSTSSPKWAQLLVWIELLLRLDAWI